MSKFYFEHPTKVMTGGEKFPHIMAIALDPTKKYKEGIVRCVTSRVGEEGASGQIDRSVLYKVRGTSLEKFVLNGELHIRNQDRVIKKLLKKGEDFIGLEDPDIWIDGKTGLTHVYFTMPMIGEKKSSVHLGHAVGKDLDSLVMTEPAIEVSNRKWAKEICIAPVNKKGFRYNLFESSDRIKGVHYSVVRRAVVKEMGKPWKYEKIVFHPAKQSAKRIAKDASPGPLLPETFIDVGEGRRLGIMNGCTVGKMVKGKKVYGTFAIGFFIYDYEKGKIDWVSPKPFIEDSEGSKIRAITFASQFVPTKKGEGIIYAHVNDSFIRAYTIKATDVRKVL